MAYFVGTAKQTATANGASYTLTLPDSYQTDDILYAVLSQDGGGTTIAPDAAAVTAGWIIVGGSGGQAASGVSRQVIALCRATSGAMTNPTFTGATDDWIGSCVPIRDVPTTWNLAALTEGVDFKRADWNNVSSAASAALTTPDDGRLIVYSWCADGNTQYMRCRLNDVTAADKYQTTNISHIIGYRQQQAAGDAPTVTMYNISATEGGNGWVLAIPNKASGALQPDIRPDVTELKWHGSWEVAQDAITWQAPSNFAASINGISCSTAAPTVANNAASQESSVYGLCTTLSNSENTASLLVGGTFAVSSTDMSGKLFSLQWFRNQTSTSALQGADGVLIGFSDGTNWVVYQVAKPEKGFIANVDYSAFIALGNAVAYASSGSINWAAVTRLAYLWHRSGSAATASTLAVKSAALFGKTALTGGGSSRPATFNDYQAAMNSWGAWRWAELQGSAQVKPKTSLQIGDGTNVTYFDGATGQLGFPQAWSSSAVANWQMDWNVNPGQVGLFVKASASDTIKLAAGAATSANAQLLTIDAASSTSATYDFGQAFGGFIPTLKTGITETGTTWTGCGKIDAKGSSLTNCTIKNTTATDAAIAWTENGATVTGTTITVTSATAYHMETGASVTAITLADVTFSGTPGTDKVHVLATTGTVTITISGSTSLTLAEVTSAGATIVIAAPTFYRGIAFTALVTGSKVKVFATGTDTELFSTNASGTSETFNDATNGSITVDYTIQKAGYLPRRVTGVVLTGQTTTAGLSPVQGLQTVARWYVASSGLTINTNAFANAGTKKFGLTAASTLQNFASYLLEQWIALGDTGEAFANKPFPIEANGPNSFSWLDGWEADLTTYPNTISLLSRDGMRYLNSSGAVTAIWAALLSAGVPAGKQVRYQQQDGIGTTNAQATGNIDQLIQIYGDATHGNYDKRSWLVLKVQTLGDYDQAEADAVVTYGTLEDQLYVVGLAPTPNGVAAQAGITGITITSELAPVLWNGQLFSVTIKDTTDTHSGLQIMQYVRGLNDFNLHDMIRPSGAKFVTVNGSVYGDTLPTPAGVRVVKADGVTPHPDFSAFSADNGAVYTPPVSAPITWAGALAGTTVLLYNDSVVGSPIIDTQVIAGAGGYTLAVSLPSGIVAAGDSLRLRYGNKAYYAGELQGTMTTSGLAFIGSMVAHPIYAAWGLNGSTYDQANGGPYTMDGINLQVDIAAGATTGLKTQLGAWTQHLMTLPAGLAAFYGAWDLLDLNQIRQNVGVVDVKIDVPTAGALFTFTDHDVNYYRSDFSYPGNVQTGHGLIAITYNASIFVPDPVVISGQSVVTGTAASIIAAIPSAADNATAIAAKAMGARTLGQHIQAQSAALLGATTGAGTSHLTFTDGAAVVEADVPLPGVAGDRSNVVISGV